MIRDQSQVLQETPSFCSLAQPIEGIHKSTACWKCHLVLCRNSKPLSVREVFDCLYNKLFFAKTKYCKLFQANRPVIDIGLLSREQ